MMMSDYVETVVMTEALPLIEKIAPNVTLELIPIVEDSEALERGEIDLAITPARLLAPGHPSERLFEDEFTCLVWSGNTQVGSSIPLKTYLKLGHVVVRFGRFQQLTTFDEWFVEQFGRERRIEVITTAFNLVPQLLIGTSRIATLHLRLAMFYQRYLPLKMVAPPVEIPRLEEHMQWHKSRDHDPGTVWLRSILRSTFSQSAIGKKAHAGRARRKNWTAKPALS
jgi:LysR family transcriptional regulator, nod-box dependent transcriptional activator